MKKILILLCLLPYLLPAQNIVQADTLRAKYGFSMGVTPTRITVREITKVVNAASTHLQLPTAKAVWDAIVANYTVLSAGTGISITGSGTTGSPYVITNTAPDQTVALTGAGITVVTGTYPTFTITSTEVDGSTTNELQTLSVAANTATLSNSGGSVTIAGAGINTVGTAGTTITITATEVDGNTANEGILGVGAGGASSSTIVTNTSGGNAVTINVAGDLSISESTSANGGSVTITGTGAAALSGVVNQVPYFNTASTITTEAGSGANALTWDGVNNRLGIGTASPSVALDIIGDLRGTSSNTSPALFSTSNSTGRVGINSVSNSGFSFQHSGSEKWVAASYLPSGTNYSFTFYNVQTSSDGMFINGDNNNVGFGNNSPQRKLHVTGEARITDLTTDTPTRIVGADADGDLGAITVGSGLSLSGGTLSTSGGTSWLLGGNTLGAANTIGSNDNFDVSVETNGTSRLWVDNTGPVTVGSTVSTAAALVVNGLQSNTGFAIIAGSGLVSPAYISTRGDGSGTTAQVLDARHSMIGGTVATIVENTATIGNSNALASLIVNSASTGDPYASYTISGGTQWVEGIDNSDADKFKLRNGSTLGTTNTGLTVTTGNLFGFNQNAPSVTAEFTGTDGIVIPQGTTAQRPSLTGEGPVVRYNQNGGSFELGDHNKNNYFRLTGLSSPSVAVGGAAGTGATVELTSGAGSNDCSGSIDLTTGTSTGVGTVLTLTYFEPYNGSTSFVMLNAGNDIATTQCNRYSCQSSSNTTFTIRAVTALDASTTYRIKYLVRAY